MKYSLRVPFGFREGRLLEPCQVLNGKLCGCVCPSCGKSLIAKQNASTPHFAHAQGESCARGFESAVHLAVKQIIADRKELRFPALIWENPFPHDRQKIKVDPEKTLSLESVVLEQWLGDFRPDIVIVADEKPFLIEVAVTHFVNDVKLQKIVNRNVPTFEIDASKLKRGFTLADLEHAIYNSSNYQAKWVFHPQLEELTRSANLKEEQRVAALREERLERLRKFERYRNLTPGDKLKINLKSVGISRQQLNGLSVFVPWDTSFCVPRIVWQSAVLAFIVKTQEEQGWDKYFPCSVNSNTCLGWLEDVFEVKPKVPNGEKIAVWKYFLHLETLGILKRLIYQDFDILIGSKEWSSLNTIGLSQPE